MPNALMRVMRDLVEVNQQQGQEPRDAFIQAFCQVTSATKDEFELLEMDTNRLQECNGVA